MNKATSTTDPPVLCPICGQAAERGCLYGSDSGVRLRWFPGEPRLWANLSAGLGGGTAVGDRSFTVGAHAEGIRCQRCRQITIAC